MCCPTNCQFMCLQLNRHPGQDQTSSITARLVVSNPWGRSISSVQCRSCQSCWTGQHSAQCLLQIARERRIRRRTCLCLLEPCVRGAVSFMSSVSWGCFLSHTWVLWMRDESSLLISFFGILTWCGLDEVECIGMCLSWCRCRFLWWSKVGSEEQEGRLSTGFIALYIYLLQVRVKVRTY